MTVKISDLKLTAKGLAALEAMRKEESGENLTEYEILLFKELNEVGAESDEALNVTKEANEITNILQG